jgi:murein DD-endopeptidase MepM/ murein hydrolase activator NlpD
LHRRLESESFQGGSKLLNTSIFAKIINTINKKIDLIKNSSLIEKNLKISKKIYNSASSNKTISSAFTVLLLTASVLPTVYAGSLTGETSGVTKVFNVYFDNEYIGTVKNKDFAKRIINEKLKENQEQNENYNFTVANDIKIVSENVFTPVYNEKQVKEKIGKAIEVKVVTYNIIVDGKSIVHLTSEEEAHQALEEIKSKFVSSKTLEQASQMKKANVKKLQVGESRVVDVAFYEEIAIEKAEAPASDVKSVNDATSILIKGTKRPVPYSVVDGDSLGTIAEKFNLRTRDLLTLNPGITENTLLQIGQKLNVSAVKPFVNVIVKKEEVRKVSVPYATQYKSDPTIFKGTTKVIQEGIDGEKIVDYAIIVVNNKTKSIKAVSQDVTKQSTPKIIARGTKEVPSRGTGNLAWPASGGYVSSKMGYRWGRFHKGIDIAGPSSLNIKAADNGTVTFAGWDGNYGNKVVINHNNGMKTVYAHLSSISVYDGQVVQRGQSIGIMGSTGDSTGTHLHFEVYKNGSVVNPMLEL